MSLLNLVRLVQNKVLEEMEHLVEARSYHIYRLVDHGRRTAGLLYER